MSEFASSVSVPDKAPSSERCVLNPYPLIVVPYSDSVLVHKPQLNPQTRIWLLLLRCMYHLNRFQYVADT